MKLTTTSNTSEKSSSEQFKFTNLNVLQSSANLFRSISIPSFTVSLNTFFGWVITLIVWVKTRTSYAMNSWIYTTNHKRIAVNYFSFVLVSGTAGMGLATVIRLEFAYPGVGVLAGDSLQYLSTATAHGVIMVFFMIMPLIFWNIIQKNFFKTHQSYFVELTILKKMP